MGTVKAFVGSDGLVHVVDTYYDSDESDVSDYNIALCCDAMVCKISSSGTRDCCCAKHSSMCVALRRRMMVPWHAVTCLACACGSDPNEHNATTRQRDNVTT